MKGETRMQKENLYCDSCGIIKGNEKGWFYVAYHATSKHLYIGIVGREEHNDDHKHYCGMSCVMEGLCLFLQKMLVRI